MICNNDCPIILNFAYLLSRKKPPNIIKGMSNGADIAKAICNDGAMQEVMYPNPTTTYHEIHMKSS